MNRKFGEGLLRWHRRIGIVVALFLLMLASTGILLNHTTEIGLDKKSVGAQWILQLYGIGEPSITSFRLDDVWLSQLGLRRLYLDLEPIAPCESSIIGAVIESRQIVVGCERELNIYSQTGELIEQVTQAHGLPTPLIAIGRMGNAIYFEVPQGGYLYNAQLSEWTKSNLHPDIVWAKVSQSPPALKSELKTNYQGSGIHYERLLLDLHSGRLFGDWGVLLMDLVAFLIGLIALSGLWIWIAKPARRNSR